jgi:phage terminase small subunit
MSGKRNGKNGSGNGKAVEVREIVPPADRHERFCQEYLLDLNATAAYMRTYPDASSESARASAPRLLANLSNRIAELQAERANRVQVSQDAILREFMLIGFSDPRHFTVSELGHLELADGAPEEAWRAVSSVKHRITSNGDFTTREIEFRLWNKNNALELLGKHIGMFPNKVEHGGPGGGPIPVEFTFDLGGSVGQRRQLEDGGE